MNKVISLAVRRPGDPDTDLITALQTLLDEAKSGQLQGIAYAAMYSDGCYKVDWDGVATALPTYGAIGMLSYAFAQALDEVLPEDNS